MTDPPAVDYLRTSERPAWDTLPGALRDALAVALRTEIRAAGTPVGSGFTGGFAARLDLADGRTVFAKAASTPLHAYSAYQREAELVPRLPSAVPSPRPMASTPALRSGVRRSPLESRPRTWTRSPR